MNSGTAFNFIFAFSVTLKRVVIIFKQKSFILNNKKFKQLKFKFSKKNTERKCKNIRQVASKQHDPGHF